MISHHFCFMNDQIESLSTGLRLVVLYLKTYYALGSFFDFLRILNIMRAILSR